MILVTGGTGFVGRHLIARLLSEGEQVRVLARRGVEFPGTEVVASDVTEPSTLRESCDGCRAVIHLVGIIRETRGSSFHRVHVQGTGNIIEACQRAGVQRLLHMSALGTRERAASRYHRSKWEAERLVRASGLAATIFRPSVMFGTGGAYLPMIKGLVTMAPVIPIIGDGMSLVQPIWVEDVVSCFLGALRRDETAGHTYELGGAETYGFEQLVDLIAEVNGVDKPKVHLPVWLMRAAAIAFDLAGIGVPALRRFPLTPDQLTMLLEDNCCDIGEMRETFGVEPVSVLGHLQEQ